MGSTSGLSPHHGAAVPTPLQVALAVAIVRTKPDGMTARDYVLELRAAIKPGLRPDRNEGSPARYIDNTAYWQDRCKKLENTCQKLEVANDELRRAQDALQIAQPIKRARGSSLQSQGVKRKKPEERGVESVMDSQGTIPDDLAVFDALGEAGKRLSHHLYTTHSLYARDSTAPDVLGASLVQTTRAIGTILSSTAKHHDIRSHAKKRPALALENDASEMASLVRASGRSFTAIMVCLKKVTADTVTSRERRPADHVIYEIVNLYHTVLTTIADSALRIAEARSTPTDKPSSKAKARGSPKDTAVSRYLAQFLNSIISFLNKDDPLHRDLFEGILYIILEHVAKCFNRCAALSVGEDAYVTEVGTFAILNDQEPSAVCAKKKELEAQALHIEIRPLLSILEKALAFAPAHLNTRPISVSSTLSKRRTTSTAWNGAFSEKLPQSPVAPKYPLSTQVKEKMRRTLMDFIFPSNGNDEFADVLRKPARLVPLPVFRKEGSNVQSVEELFMESVWELFGLEALETEDWMSTD